MCIVVLQQELAATEHVFEHIKLDRDVRAASEPSAFASVTESSRLHAMVDATSFIVGSTFQSLGG